MLNKSDWLDFVTFGLMQKLIVSYEYSLSLQ